jgi:hypothetical protein
MTEQVATRKQGLLQIATGTCMAVPVSFSLALFFASPFLDSWGCCQCTRLEL